MNIEIIGRNPEARKVNTTLGQIREQSEFCSEHLHNTLAESKACKRNQCYNASVLCSARVHNPEDTYYVNGKPYALQA